jgi:hypothetical protein
VAGADTITAAYSGDLSYAPTSGTTSLTALAQPSSVLRSARPANSFALSRPKLNTRRGSAILTVIIPGPGKLLLKGAGIEKRAKSVRRVGKVTLTVNATGKTKRKLGRTGNATVTARVTYTPAGGDPKTRSTHFALRRDRRSARPVTRALERSGLLPKDRSRRLPCLCER